MHAANDSDDRPKDMTCLRNLLTHGSLNVYLVWFLHSRSRAFIKKNFSRRKIINMAYICVDTSQCVSIRYTGVETDVAIFSFIKECRAHTDRFMPKRMAKYSDYLP